VLTGSSRWSQAARENAALVRQQGVERNDRERKRKRKRELLEARIAALRKEFEMEEEDAEISSAQESSRARITSENREAMARSRHADRGKDGTLAKGRRSQ
jgi:circadian clock protein KaiC